MLSVLQYFFLLKTKSLSKAGAISLHLYVTVKMIETLRQGGIFKKGTSEVMNDRTGVMIKRKLLFFMLYFLQRILTETNIAV